jgi:pimeloyl-ACP methyl ester carboxylesterase
MAVQWKSDELTVNGIRTQVLSAGKGEPVMFWHGAGTAGGWDFTAPWTERFKVYVPLHPGFGGSADDTSISSIQDYVMHYLELVDMLKLGKFSVVGHSMGGWIGSTFATQHADRLKKLVLIAPAGLYDKEHPATDIFSIKPEELVPYLAHNLAALGPPPEIDMDFIVNSYRESTSWARVAWQRNYDPKLAKWLHRITVPTLFVWGKQDRICPVTQAPVWMKLIPGSTLKTFDGAGHLVFIEQPDSVRAIGEYLAS